MVGMGLQCFDSVKASQTYSITLKRQSRGDVVVVYDSTLALCRNSRDSIVNNLSSMGATFDLYNRNSNTDLHQFHSEVIKKVIFLEKVLPVMSNTLKDSLKSYSCIRGNSVSTKSKLIIFRKILISS